MLHGIVDDPGSLSPDELREAHETELRAAIAGRDTDALADETGVEAATLSRIVEGGSAASLPVTDAARVLALRDDVPDADTIVSLLRDDLMMSMATAVVDVDTVASNIDHDLTGQEVQQAMEGRTVMTLEQLAAIQQFVAERAA